MIQYESLTAEDDTLLSEIVSIQYIRPQPPVLKVRSFNLLDEVEAFHNSGWWPGVVAKVNDESSYNVKFMHWEEEIEFNHSELRPLYEWIDGQWIQASQVGVALFSISTCNFFLPFAFFFFLNSLLVLQDKCI